MTNTITQPVALAALDVLVGDWSWTGRSRSGDFEVNGPVNYAWLEGRQFLVERAALTSSGATNTSLTVTGYDKERDGCVATYFDSDGTRGSFGIAIRGKDVRINSEPYRFAGSFDEADDTLTGEWQMSRDGETWSHWYDMTMRRT